MPILQAYAIALLASASLVTPPAGERSPPAPARMIVARSTTPQASVQRSKARDADQRYLRALADHFEAERAVVHAIMSEPGSHASHGSAMDPAAWDATFDTQQREALALLKHDYGDVRTPRASAGAAPARTAEAEAAERAVTQALVSRMREAVALSKRALPQLRRASTRSLARQVISSHGKLIEELGAMSGH